MSEDELTKEELDKIFESHCAYKGVDGLFDDDPFNGKRNPDGSINFDKMEFNKTEFLNDMLNDNMSVFSEVMEQDLGEQPRIITFVEHEKKLHTFKNMSKKDFVHLFLSIHQMMKEEIKKVCADCPEKEKCTGI